MPLFPSRELYFSQGYKDMKAFHDDFDLIQQEAAEAEERDGINRFDYIDRIRGYTYCNEAKALLDDKYDSLSMRMDDVKKQIVLRNVEKRLEAAEQAFCKGWYKQGLKDLEGLIKHISEFIKDKDRFSDLLENIRRECESVGWR